MKKYLIIARSFLISKMEFLSESKATICTDTWFGSTFESESVITLFGNCCLVSISGSFLGSFLSTELDASLGCFLSLSREFSFWSP